MDDETDDRPPASAGRVYRSAATAVVIAWSLRFIGLFSVLILARVLTPRDFGIVALAMSTLALLDIFSALGLRQALLLIPRPQRSHYDTAWTIQLLVLTVLAGLLVMLAPLVAWFYDEPVLAVVIAVLASRFIFYGLANIGIVDFDRHLELGRDLRMRISVRLATFAVTIIAALILRNYWALVIGAVTQSVFHAAASYIVHPYRPRFSLMRRAELLGVSLWMFLASAAQTVHFEIERFVVGRIGSMNVLGFYSVSKDLSSIFTQEIATALNRVTFVTTAQTGRPLSADPIRLSTMLGTYAMIAAPLGLGLAAAAENAVQVLLGPQWTDAVPYLRLIAPASAFYAVYKLVVSSLQASGDSRHAAQLALGGTVVMVAAVSVAVVTDGGAIGVALASLLTCMALLVSGTLLLSRKARTSGVGLLFAVGRPFAAAFAMMVVLRSFGGSGIHPVIDLVVEIAVGAAVYAVLIVAIWRVSGRPRGPEANAVELLRSGARYLARHMARSS